MTNDTERPASESAALSADELTALKAASEGAWSKVGYSAGSRLQQQHLIEFGSDFDWKITPLGERVLAQATASAPEAEAAAPVTKVTTFERLCEREIVKIRGLTLKDDEYTRDLLGEAVGSPTGITLCVEARMKQIGDLKSENKRLQKEYNRVVSLNARLAKQISKYKRTADLDEGFIDYLINKEYLEGGDYE